MKISSRNASQVQPILDSLSRALNRTRRIRPFRFTNQWIDQIIPHFEPHWCLSSSSSEHQSEDMARRLTMPFLPNAKLIKNQSHQHKYQYFLLAPCALNCSAGESGHFLPQNYGGRWLGRRLFSARIFKSDYHKKGKAGIQNRNNRLSQKGESKNELIGYHKKGNPKQKKSSITKRGK